MKLGFFSNGPREEAGADEHVGTALRPDPPIAKRLNRNALTLAAVIMGMTVLTVIVVLNPSKEAKQSGTAPASTDEAPPVPARPAFLDQPVRPASAYNPHTGDGALVPRAASSAFTPPSSFTPSPPPLVPTSYPPAYITGSERAGLAPSSSANHASVGAESDRDRSYRAALASSVLVGAVEGRATGASARPTSSLATEEQQLVNLGDSILRSTRQPSATGTVTGVPTSRSDAAPPSKPATAQRSFASRAVEASGSTVMTELAPAGSPCTLRAGTVIPGLLVTGINSELPGEIVGQVSRNVYDSRSQRLLLIPKGSRLIGSYDNQIAAGQGRLLVAWTRLILPDGRSMRLPGLALTDGEGHSGAKDKVDNHWWRVFGNAVLLSAISAGVQLSQPSQTSVLSTPSAGQVASGAVGQELSNVALEILRRGMDIAPTITIRAGQPFNVFLSGDLVFDELYTPRG